MDYQKFFADIWMALFLALLLQQSIAILLPTPVFRQTVNSFTLYAVSKPCARILFRHLPVLSKLGYHSNFPNYCSVWK